MGITKEQKTLKVFSVIALIFGIIGIIFAILMFVLGGAAVGNVEAITSETGVTAEDVGKFTGVFIVSGITTLFSGIFIVINSVVLKRVAKNAAKYKGALIITIISLVFAVSSLASSLSGGEGLQGIANGAVSVLMNGYILYLINKVKDSVAA